MLSRQCPQPHLHLPTSAGHGHRIRNTAIPFHAIVCLAVSKVWLLVHGICAASSRLLMRMCEAPTPILWRLWSRTWCTYWQMSCPMLVLLSESAVSIVAFTFAPGHATRFSSRKDKDLISQQDAADGYRRGDLYSPISLEAHTLKLKGHASVCCEPVVLHDALLLRLSQLHK